MDRRTFIGGVAGGLLGAPLVARAQQMGKVYRIGMLEAIPAVQHAASLLAHFESAGKVFLGLRPHDVGW